jgi:hypothetical protein
VLASRFDYVLHILRVCPSPFGIREPSFPPVPSLQAILLIIEEQLVSLEPFHCLRDARIKPKTARPALSMNKLVSAQTRLLESSIKVLLTRFSVVTVQVAQWYRVVQGGTWYSLVWYRVVQPGTASLPQWQVQAGVTPRFKCVGHRSSCSVVQGGGSSSLVWYRVVQPGTASLPQWQVQAGTGSNSTTTAALIFTTRK